MLVSSTRTATTAICTLSLHDALPICLLAGSRAASRGCRRRALRRAQIAGRTGFGDLVDHKFQCGAGDRKSTRLNSSHTVISYAVFCLKKKKQTVVPEVDQAAAPDARV